MEQKYIESTLELIDFISDSPSSFHAVENASLILENAGFILLDERKPYVLKKGGKYYVKRNGSALIAFSVPTEKVCSYSIISAHTDSPCFKLKENPEINCSNLYTTLNVEAYGGAILSTWFDRPLSIAGRAFVKTEKGLEQRLVNIDKDLCVIPNLCIHHNRDVNKGYEYKVQTDLLPLLCSGAETGSVKELVASCLDVEEQSITETELFVYNRDGGKFFGLSDEFFTSPRIDDLMSAFCAVKALSESEVSKNIIKMVCLFDNEEVGSGTKQGADSDFLVQTTMRISDSLGIDFQSNCSIQAASMALSADNGHSFHPNHPEKCDPTNKPSMNGGILIKYSGNQKYATDGFSAANLKNLLSEEGIPYQVYFNNSNLPGGGTLGNISTSQFSIPTVDVGAAQLAMHSANETAGTMDTYNLIQAFRVFFN